MRNKTNFILLLIIIPMVFFQLHFTLPTYAGDEDPTPTQTATATPTQTATATPTPTPTPVCTCVPGGCPCDPSNPKIGLCSGAINCTCGNLGCNTAACLPRCPKSPNRCNNETKHCKCWRDPGGVPINCTPCSVYCKNVSPCPTCSDIECTCGCGFTNCLSHPDPFRNCTSPPTCGNISTTQCCGGCTPGDEVKTCSGVQDPCRTHCGFSRCACQSIDRCECPTWGYCPGIPDCKYCEFRGSQSCDEDATPRVPCPNYIP